MSSWPGKYVIGLTGNIATGKSVVRKMLEHLGAYGIDADALAHRVLAQGSPGYQPVLDTFGRWILGQDGQIDRTKLGRLVFSDPDALERLEAIVHPYVAQAIDILIRRSPHNVIVLEAIKLIESGLGKKCDSIWVAYAPQEIQTARMIQKRGFTEAAALHRIHAQPSQDEKLAAANVVIRNAGSFEDTWQQVYTSWQRTFPSLDTELAEAEAVSGELSVYRARPREAGEIAALITELSAGRRKISREEVMANFGDKAYLLLRLNGKSRGVVGWKVENLVARTDDVFLDGNLPLADALRALMEEVERASKELQCEASLLFLPSDLGKQEAAFRSLGYQKRIIQSLGVRAWEEAAEESMPAGTILLFKQLRQDRVLRPV